MRCGSEGGEGEEVGHRDAPAFKTRIQPPLNELGLLCDNGEGAEEPAVAEDALRDVAGQRGPGHA